MQTSSVTVGDLTGPRPLGADPGAAAPRQPTDARNAAATDIARPVTPPRTAEAATAARSNLQTAMSDLSPEEQEVLRQLQARDREVRAHERAHATVGGEYAGSPSYTFQTGPDGRQYAIGGEVPIDVAPIPDDPQATVVKMEIVRRAALAPAEPSDADRRIAALADAQRQEAMADLIALRAAERAISAREDTEKGPAGPLSLDLAA